MTDALRSLIAAGAWCAEQERERQTPRRRRRERRMREVLATLQDPIMGVGPDHEIAADHGVTSAVVRHLRDRLARDRATHAIQTRLSELATRVGWRGSLDALLVRVLERALTASERRAEARAASGATSPRVRPETGHGGAARLPQTNGDRGRSAGRVNGRSERTTKRSEGTSGIGSRGGDYREASLGPAVQAVGKSARGEGEG